MSKYIYHHYYESKSNIPTSRSTKPGWEKNHEFHQQLINNNNGNILLIGDSIIKNLNLYNSVWNRFFRDKAVNCGFGGGLTQNVLWRAFSLDLSSNIKFVVIYIGTNNLSRSSPIEIINGILAIGNSFKKRYPDKSVIICGLLPQDSPTCSNRTAIDYINHHLKNICESNKFNYINPGNEWTKPNDDLDMNLFFHDKLHLIEQSCIKFSTMIENEINRISSVTNNMNTYKICPQQNKDEYPPLKNTNISLSIDKKPGKKSYSCAVKYSKKPPSSTTSPLSLSTVKPHYK